MNLVEDYLRAVSLLLPRGQRDDIIAELRDTVLNRIEARETELGRPLSDAEVEDVLRTVGHPITVAAAYGEGPRHAVGPTLYPYWAFALKVGVALQLSITVITMIIRGAATGDFTLAMDQAIRSAINGPLILIGLATGACWLAERRGMKFDHALRWRVRDLRSLQLVAWDWSGVLEALTQAGRGASASRARMRWSQRRGRDRAAAGMVAIVFGCLALMWWTGLAPLAIVSGPQEAQRLDVELGPLSSVPWTALKHALWLPVAGGCLLIIGRGAALLLRPDSRRLAGAFDVASGLLTLAVLRWLWFDSPLGTLIRVDSVAGFFIRMREGVFHPAPVDVTPILTLIVVAVAIAALVRTVRGATLMVFADPAWTLPASIDEARQG